MKEQYRILIIDDNENMRESLSDILQEKGYDVVTAKTASEGMQKAQDTFFNIALIDINLPDKSGIELLSRFKGMFPYRANVMISASTMQNDAINALNIGADAYLKKPIDFDKLDKVLENCLKKQRDNLKAMDERLKDFMANTPEGEITRS